MDQSYHKPVMADTVVDLFRPIPDGIIVDATYGGGGHASRIAEDLGRDVLGIDRDPDAEGALRGNFRDLARILEEQGIDRIAGILFDLGVSSHQLDQPERGFSFRKPGPLDMRMGPDAATEAGTLVNTLSERALADLIRRYGEERFARRIAAAIVAHRPVADTTELAEIVKAAIPAATRRSGGHPARRTFQALRIAVNEEMEALREGLDAGLSALEPGGRCVVISYHSLEDRIVKRRFAEGAQGCTCPPDLPVCGCGRTAELRILTRKSLTADPDEVAQNPRARSARLRAVEKVAA